MHIERWGKEMTFKALYVLLLVGLCGCATQQKKTTDSQGLNENNFSVEKKSIYALCSVCEKRTKKILNIDDELNDVDVPKVQAIVKEEQVVKEVEQKSEVSIEKFIMHFDFDKSKTNKDQIVELGKFLDATVSKDKKIQITVLGNADPRGKLSYNKVLSKKRADYVFSLLVKAGIQKNRITTAIEEPCCQGSKTDKEVVQIERRRATVIIEVR